MRVPRPLVLASLALLCAIAAFPYLELLAIGPVALDSAEWITRGATLDPDWSEWVFATRHFGVGYRPLTALSFTLNQAVSGFEPAAFRATDLALHLSGGLLVYAFYCALAHREARRQIGALIAAAIFLLHPAVEDVLPTLARRSYLLATVFSLAGLWALARSLISSDAPGSSRAPGSPVSLVAARIGSGLLLSAALFSNESSAMSIVAVPAVAAVTIGRTDWRSVLAASSIPLAISGFAVALRLTLIGGAGGYELSEPLSSRVGPVLHAAWRSLGGLGVGDAPAAVGVALLLIFAWALWQLAQAARRPWTGGHPVLLLGAAWLVGSTLLYASQGVWYPRQSYLLLVPFALTATQLAVGTSATGARAWMARIPVLVLFALLLWASPALRGMDPNLSARLERQNANLEALNRALDGARSPALVRLVVPFQRFDRPSNPLRADAPPELHRDYFAAAVWLNALRFRDAIVVKDFVFYEVGAAATTPPRFTDRSARAAATLHLASRAYRSGGPLSSPRMSDAPANSTIAMDPAAAPGVHEYVLILDARSGELHPL